MTKTINVRNNITVKKVGCRHEAAEKVAED